jgi:DNA primase
MELKKIKKLLGNNLDLVLSELEIEYQKNGDNLTCPCPVHEGSDNPNGFSFSVDRQIWGCWTRGCHQEFGNDILGLIRGTLSIKTGEEVGFPKALRWACRILNVDSKDVQVNKEEEPDEFVKLVNILSQKDPSHEDSCAIIDCDVSHPSDYFCSRGFSEDTLLHFEVGDCLQKKSSMVNRAIIPIHNSGGDKIVSYIGRSVRDYVKPKFLFTSGFNKTKYLYNYHRAKEKIHETSCVFLTEGQGDVWKLYEAGVENAVSIFGKSLSFFQKSMLEKSGATKLVVLTDNDQAGRESKVKIQREMSRMFKVIFPRMSKKDIGDMTAKQIKEDILPQLEGMF